MLVGLLATPGLRAAPDNTLAGFRAVAAAVVLPGVATRPAPGDPLAEAAERALESWRWALREQSLVMQDRTLRDLGAHDHPLIVEELLAYLPDSEIALRPTLRRLLGRLVHPECQEVLRNKGLRSRNALVREQIALAIGEALPAGDNWGELLLPLLNDRRGEVRAAAIFALGRLRYGAAQAELLEATADRSPAVRRQSADALVRAVGSRAVGAVIPLLDDENWRVRSAAARALGNVRSSAAARALIERLDIEAGRVREEILASLSQLTGQSLGLNLAAWERWLELSGDELIAPLQSEAKRKPTNASPSVARYYGVPTLSTRFLIITDLSGSMNTIDHGGYRNTSASGLSKLQVTKDELNGLVRSLPSDVLFNLITFSDEVSSWVRQLAPADDRHRIRAQETVANWTASGGTNLFAALKTALDLAEAEWRGDRAAQDRSPDTVYVLTDGAPHGGVIDDMPLLLAYVNERNRDLDLRFHVIALTSVRDQRDFLTLLAKSNGGTALTPLD
ncbi:MAG: hypothetical protein DHS20C15_00050 [Planctomycetota bacterium]|nr:MAG: hypothetical protein DHS20C15_00050 [Planctomycetota bacterium]